MPYQRYKFDATECSSKILDDIDIQLLYITRSGYDRHWQSVMHSHPFTEFFYVVSGMGKFNIEGKSFSVKEDDFVVINPNVMHTEFADGKNALEYIVLGIEGISFQQSSHNKDYSLYNLKNQRNEILFYLKSIIQELHEKKEGYVDICMDLLEVFILLLRRSTKSTLTFPSVNKISRECRFIEQYLDEHFADDITLETLSTLTHMNKYYMVHAFKKYKGISPINYLTDRRIAEAKHLLESTNYPIAKIADATGFSSQSYFSQVFRKETGVSPILYRKLGTQ